MPLLPLTPAGEHVIASTTTFLEELLESMRHVRPVTASNENGINGGCSGGHAGCDNNAYLRLLAVVSPQLMQAVAVEAKEASSAATQASSDVEHPDGAPQLLLPPCARLAASFTDSELRHLLYNHAGADGGLAESTSFAMEAICRPLLLSAAHSPYNVAYEQALVAAGESLSALRELLAVTSRKETYPRSSCGTWRLQPPALSRNLFVDVLQLEPRYWAALGLWMPSSDYEEVLREAVLASLPRPESTAHAGFLAAVIKNQILSKGATAGSPLSGFKEGTGHRRGRHPSPWDGVLEVSASSEEAFSFLFPAPPVSDNGADSALALARQRLLLLGVAMPHWGDQWLRPCAAMAGADGGGQGSSWTPPLSPAEQLERVQVVVNRVTRLLDSCEGHYSCQGTAAALRRELQLTLSAPLAVAKDHLAWESQQLAGYQGGRLQGAECCLGTAEDVREEGPEGGGAGDGQSAVALQAEGSGGPPPASDMEQLLLCASLLAGRVLTGHRGGATKRNCNIETAASSMLCDPTVMAAMCSENGLVLTLPLLAYQPGPVESVLQCGWQVVLASVSGGASQPGAPLDHVAAEGLTRDFGTLRGDAAEGWVRFVETLVRLRPPNEAAKIGDFLDMCTPTGLEGTSEAESPAKLASASLLRGPAAAGEEQVEAQLRAHLDYAAGGHRGQAGHVNLAVCRAMFSGAWRGSRPCLLEDPNSRGRHTSAAVLSDTEMADSEEEEEGAMMEGMEVVPCSLNDEVPNTDEEDIAAVDVATVDSPLDSLQAKRQGFLKTHEETVVRLNPSLALLLDTAESGEGGGGGSGGGGGGKVVRAIADFVAASIGLPPLLGTMTAESTSGRRPAVLREWEAPCWEGIEGSLAAMVSLGLKTRQRVMAELQRAADEWAAELCRQPVEMSLRHQLCTVQKLALAATFTASDNCIASLRALLPSVGDSLSRRRRLGHPGLQDGIHKLFSVPQQLTLLALVLLVQPKPAAQGALASTPSQPSSGRGSPFQGREASPQPMSPASLGFVTVWRLLDALEPLLRDAFTPSAAPLPGKGQGAGAGAISLTIPTQHCPPAEHLEQQLSTNVSKIPALQWIEHQVAARRQRHQSSDSHAQQKGIPANVAGESLAAVCWWASDTFLEPAMGAWLGEGGAQDGPGPGPRSLRPDNSDDSNNQSRASFPAHTMLLAAVNDWLIGKEPNGGSASKEGEGKEVCSGSGTGVAALLCFCLTHPLADVRTAAATAALRRAHDHRIFPAVCQTALEILGSIPPSDVTLELLAVAEAATASTLRLKDFAAQSQLQEVLVGALSRCVDGLSNGIEPGEQHFSQITVTAARLSEMAASVLTQANPPVSFHEGLLSPLTRFLEWASNASHGSDRNCRAAVCSCLRSLTAMGLRDPRVAGLLTSGRIPNAMVSGHEHAWQAYLGSVELLLRSPHHLRHGGAPASVASVLLRSIGEAFAWQLGINQRGDMDRRRHCSAVRIRRVIELKLLAECDGGGNH
mmetsp:Transcript_24974/g.69664  ORF Transcript_24974/g.69664 Transcript_24974/m.69664 type:complete len:1490 (-) Transcript_24974:526-4995(-)